MTVTTIDTFAYIKKLKKAGVPEKQAEAHVHVTTEIMKKHLVTKQDMKQELAILKAELKADLTLRMGTITAAGATAVLTFMPIIFKLVRLM